METMGLFDYLATISLVSRAITNSSLVGTTMTLIGESAVEAVAREWKEELSLSVRVGQFLFCGESVPAESRRTQVFQMVFQIDAIEGNIEVKREGALAGYDWVPINSLDDIAFFPDCLAQVKAACRGERFDTYQKYRWLT